MCDSSAAVRDVFDDWARRGRAEGMARSHLPAVTRALERFSLSPRDWFLDIGCGSGYVVRWASQRVARGHAFGVDISPEMIRICRQDAPSNASFVQGAFPGVALPEGRFDAIFSMEVFYYLPDLDGALQAVRRLLAPGGTFVCLVDFYRENADSHGWPDDLGVPMELRSQAEWNEAFTNAGFNDVRQERILVPPEESKEPFRWTVGSLLTSGVRD